MDAAVGSGGAPQTHIHRGAITCVQGVLDFLAPAGPGKRVHQAVARYPHIPAVDTKQRVRVPSACVRGDTGARCS